ncbi:hypothetical protein GLOTRDRAFT_138088 [Gloeophyllum trabeum ATCC 11539]|uniref:Cryptic loci regulator 2 N-terminal domain-containing protein n=1 Tax=Gloeophyllum trabeum (strain ATCC 11539 / FP-39264 / Madison 617) TaxID=670483 RepID=S7Q8L4_GLOTA|nr:uncharacterized protein GLOTRDRAFT_138088 [Gloeophyllum trabeum ATCC 11539]EPQ56326.1 hypothetical protein GLOTRDRAFT_138088 [Gloeophyllum trabeum ATCC 11539]
MSTHRGHGGNHQLPANPAWIEIPRSDGDSSQWPTNTTRVVDHEGHVNFMRPCALDESASIGWRRNIGTNLAKRLGLPDGRDYVLKAWPEGYQMFDHNKGPQDAPRHDPYLIGSVNVKRFRSVPEFLPHALWLIQDPTMNRANCQCKYCGKTPQRIVSESFGFSPGRSAGSVGPSQSPGPSTRVPRPPKPKVQREGEAVSRPVPYTAIRKAPAPAKRPKTHEPKQSMSSHRANDLAAAYSGIEPRRQFRVGELVWCALDPPIMGKTILSSIFYWPGIIKETSVKSEAIIDPAEWHRVNDLGAEHNAHPIPSTSAEAGPITPQKPLWDVRQWFEFKVHLQGISSGMVTVESKLLPYQAYAVPYELMLALHEAPIQNLDTSPETISAFNPCHPKKDQTRVLFDDAVAPYSLALQVASSLATYWTPTDEWDLTMDVRPPPSSALPAHSSGSPWPTWPPEEVSGPSDLTPDELKSLSVRMLGQPPASPSKSYTQTHYQGLWWGPERIWVDDLIRLKPARRQIAPQGTDKIKPPSGPGRATLEYLAAVEAKAHEDGMDVDRAVLPPQAMGAQNRGVFMKLEEVYLAEYMEGGKPKKEARACGMLYELADEDWEDDSEGSPPPQHSNGKGKEKAREDGQGFGPVPPGGQDGPAYMPGPSPLKPPPLPNPSPSVALQDTAASVLKEALPSTHGHVTSKSANGSSVSTIGQVKPPLLSTTYPLPLAPHKYKFRQILPTGYQVVVVLSLISGRYYPRIAEHPEAFLAGSRIRKESNDDAVFEYLTELTSLEGVTPGYYNAVEATKWKPNRITMFKEADEEGRTDTWNTWQAKRRLLEEEMVVDM